GRLQTEEEFGDIIVKTEPNGAITRLRDIARIELGASEYALRSLLDNKPAVAVPIFAAPNSNALQISDDVRRTMAEIKKNMPDGVDYQIVYDPTQFVRASIKSVVHTLLESVALVVLVVILFLQTWRASIIPLVAVLLKPHDGRPKNWFFRGFNRIFGAGTRSYSASLGGVLSRKALMMGFYVVLLGAAALLFNKVPDGFVPTQDKQYLIGFAQLPDGATLDRTEDVMRRMGEIMMKQPGVENAVGFPGLS